MSEDEFYVSRGEKERPGLLIRQLKELVDRAVESGYGDLPVVVDTCAAKFDAHLVDADRAYMASMDPEEKDETGKRNFEYLVLGFCTYPWSTSPQQETSLQEHVRELQKLARTTAIQECVDNAAASYTHYDQHNELEAARVSLQIKQNLVALRDAI